MQNVSIGSSPTNSIPHSDLDRYDTSTNYNCTYVNNSNYYPVQYHTDPNHYNYINPMYSHNQDPSYFGINNHSTPFHTNINNSYPNPYQYSPIIEQQTINAPPEITSYIPPIDEANFSIDTNIQTTTISPSHYSPSINSNDNKSIPENITPAFNTNNYHKQIPIPMGPIPLPPINSFQIEHNNNNSTTLATDNNVNINGHLRYTANKYECNMCSKSFKHLQNLKIHSIVHTGAAYKCTYCGKKFARNSNLKQHLRVHTGEKPFTCVYCKRGFKQKHSLKDHIRLHTGEKPFICNVCSERFHVKSALSTHQKKHVIQ